MTHLRVVESFEAPEPVMSLAQARELRAHQDCFGFPLIQDEPIDARTVTLTASQIGFLEAASNELRSQRFLLYPVMLDGIARQWHEAGGKAVS